MSNLLKLPTQSELAELSNSDLYQCVIAAFQQWQEAKRADKDTAELKKIYYAYDTEHRERLHRIKKYLI